MRVLIADDEAHARARLLRLLEPILDLEVVGTAINGRDALQQCAQTRPDLLFLDVEMPTQDGIEVAAQVQVPAIVFTTAHPRFAVAAFDVGACDFLVKPLDRPRIERALVRVQQRLAACGATPARPQACQLIVYHRGICQFFDARTVTRFWSDDKYTAFCGNGVEHLLRESLDLLAERLLDFGFLRVHRAQLIRLSAVRAVESSGSAAHAVLDDGQVAAVSRRALPALRRALLGRV